MYTFNIRELLRVDEFVNLATVEQIINVNSGIREMLIQYDTGTFRIYTRVDDECLGCPLLDGFYTRDDEDLGCPQLDAMNVLAVRY